MDDPLLHLAENQNNLLDKKYSGRRITLTRGLYCKIFVPIGILCFIMAIILKYTVPTAIEIVQEYDDYCPLGKTCDFIISVPKPMKFPIALLYQLDNFYQNHLGSVGSRSDAQLLGKYVDFDKMKMCAPYRSHNDSKDPTQWILPCGVEAISYFNDSFSMIPYQDINPTGCSRSGIKVRALNSRYSGHKWLEDNIVFPTEYISHRFSIWMDTAAFPSFRKMYGIIKGSGYLAGPNITISITNNYDATVFNGRKSLVLTTQGYDAVSLQYLFGLFIATGIVIELFCVFIFVYKK
ncbi:putative 45.0 kDa protein in NOT1-MATAL2 intergenic region-related protein [Trichomonas vaginalis G3]|uniref:Hypothetical 45.0 kDa protein in NOT1-MATAL2 intergenic region-related protein n=1 Tax=Trichomonas vaginalis (strain ATCC PRA-98 / G3) TaxID=412133 RepID=A2E4J6_TRIV3|nr:uncharacterized protein TVAGG3_1050540 [Trichomonas vaginalis G3]EAY12418.1 putative 45.0 kDa protein in NOT1-MATAL2 intergenic region-related protein [Trichomonas vaginalis G3]KAI5494181.1 aminophospholipid transmembrane transporter protein [Trichomonas vaginalis G3]|eukprot:XP_001324641.1 hypothetical protein [Trichomonas vaginalis G3]